MALRLFFLQLFLLFSFDYAVGQISVPDYSFTGREITGFTVSPGYTLVNFDFKPPSKMDMYIQNRESEFTSSEKQDYSAEEPGMMYSGSVSTSLSSVFVGEKAYRNNIVKTFLRKEYIDVIEAYEKYAEKLKTEEYKNECELLYGLSLYETGSHRQAFDILNKLSTGNGQYAEIAQDSLFNYLSSLKRWDALEQVAQNIIAFSPYSLAIWLKYLKEHNKYEEIITILNNYHSFEQEFPQFVNLRVTAYYFLKDYKSAIAYESNMKASECYPLILDSMIMLGDAKTASELTTQLPDSEVKSVILAKAAIATGDFRSASEHLKYIKNDNDLLALLFYAFTDKFDILMPEFLSSFDFTHKPNNDYVNYFKGIKYLSQDNYVSSLNSFSLVTFNKNMIVDSYFYQGMAAIHVDFSRAEWNFVRYIGSGSHKEWIMISKFMLSQLYFSKNRYDDALMLIDDCSEDYCGRLKGNILLVKGQNSESITALTALEDDRARLIRANAYYNLKQYGKALNELSKINVHTPDSRYLLMMSLFKVQRYDEAANILENNKDDQRIFSSGIEQLILAGMGKKALEYMESLQRLPLSYKADYAKLLQAEERNKEAEKIYRELLASNVEIYKSLEGLFQISQIKGETKQFLRDTFAYIEKSPSFQNKDLLTARFAGYSMDVNEPNLAIGYVNYFMDNFKESPYLTDVYHTRARLFKFTARYENCISDADKIISLGGDNSEALFLKAECMENIDKNQAITLYRSLAVSDGRFYQPASGRLAILSDDPDEILEVSGRMKQVAPDIYKSGVIRFLEISDNTSFIKHSTSIATLASEGPDDVRATAIWRIGKDYSDRQMYEEAAREYLKGYYLFPKEKYAIKNLEGAKASYDAREMKTQSDKVSQLIESYNIKVNKTTSSSPKKDSSDKRK